MEKQPAVWYIETNPRRNPETRFARGAETLKYFSALIKPASSLCNMRCAYCFYSSLAAGRDTAVPSMMSASTASALIDKVYAFCGRGTAVGFTFQGGEPTLAGRGFFERFCREAAEKNAGRFELSFAIQTNGLLLDDKWCGLFKQYGFLVGLSLDGGREIHDRNRSAAGGSSTFGKVSAAAKLLARAGVPFNILCVVTDASARRAREIYRGFSSSGYEYIHFIPCLAPIGDSEPDRFLSPQNYAAFLKEVFDAYCEDDPVSRPRVRNFDNYLMLLRGQPAEMCGAMGFCTPQFVVESDGAVYPCDFFALERFACGNINTEPVAVIAESRGIADFLAFETQKNALCAECPVYPVCGGGCKRYRPFYFMEAGYCPLRDFLEYALERLRALAFTVPAG